MKVTDKLLMADVLAEYIDKYEKCRRFARYGESALPLFSDEDNLPDMYGAEATMSLVKGKYVLPVTAFGFPLREALC